MKQVVVVVLLLVVVLCLSCLTTEASSKGARRKIKKASAETDAQTPTGSESKLQVQVEHRPSDCEVKSKIGDKLTMHYTGFLTDGQVFDSSQGRTPFEFTIGEGKVIPGWERGLIGMCIGEKRNLVIPPHLAYGEKGFPPVIPPSSTLVFKVELIDLSSS